MTKELWDNSDVDERFTHHSLSYSVALLTHTNNVFLFSKTIFLVSYIDSGPVPRVVLQVRGMCQKPGETPVILVMLLRVTSSWPEHYFFPSQVTMEDFEGWLMPFCWDLS